MTGRWTEEERTRVCQHLAGVINHVRLLLIGTQPSLDELPFGIEIVETFSVFNFFLDSQVFAEEVEPTGAVPMEKGARFNAFRRIFTDIRSTSFQK